MEKIDITLNVAELKEIVKEQLKVKIEASITRNNEQIVKQLDDYFGNRFLKVKDSDFETYLDYAVESCFREGLKQATEELNLTQLICDKAKDLLSKEDYLRDMAHKKVCASLGLKED